MHWVGCEAVASSYWVIFLIIIRLPDFLNRSIVYCGCASLCFTSGVTLILSEDRDVKTRYYYPIPQYFTYCTLFISHSIILLMLFLIFLIILGFYSPLFVVGLTLRDFSIFCKTPFFAIVSKSVKNENKEHRG